MGNVPFWTNKKCAMWVESETHSGKNQAFKKAGTRTCATQDDPSISLHEERELDVHVLTNNKETDLMIMLSSILARFWECMMRFMNSIDCLNRDLEEVCWRPSQRCPFSLVNDPFKIPLQWQVQSQRDSLRWNISPFSCLGNPFEILM